MMGQKIEEAKLIVQLVRNRERIISDAADAINRTPYYASSSSAFMIVNLREEFKALIEKEMDIQVAEIDAKLKALGVEV